MARPGSRWKRRLVLLLLLLLAGIVLASPSSRRRRHLRRRQTEQGQRQRQADLERVESLRQTGAVASLELLARLGGVAARSSVAPSDEPDWEAMVGDSLTAVARRLSELDSAETERLLAAAEALRPELGADRALQLDSVAAALRRRDYRRALGRFVAAADADDWVAAATAGTAAAGGRGAPAGAPCLPDLEAELSQFVEAVGEIELLSRVEQLVMSRDDVDDKEASRLLADAGSRSDDGRRPLLELVGAELSQLRQVRRLERIVRSPAANMPPVELDRLIEDVLGPSQSGAMVRRLRLDLSLQAFLEGDLAAASHLLPATLPRELRQQRLEEIRSFLAGSGVVRSWPFRNRLRRRGPPPVGARRLMDRRHVDRWPAELQLGPQDPAGTLQWIAGIEQQLTSDIVRQLDQRRSRLQHRGREVMAAADEARQSIRQLEERQAQLLQKLDQQLPTPLTELEAAVAVHLDCRGDSQPEVLAAIQRGRSLSSVEDAE